MSLAIFNVLSLLLGVGSWLVPMYSWIKKSFSLNRIIFSLGLAILSLFTFFLSQFIWISQEDWSALLDTYSTLRVCVIALVTGVFIFNAFSWIKVRIN